MKAAGLAPVLAAALVLLGCQRWEDYAAPEGSFSVSRPGTPKVTTVDQPTPAGTFQRYIFALERENLPVAYHVEYFDRRTIHGQAGPEEGLRLSRDGVVEFNRGTILAEQALTLDEHPGREITIERPDAITIRTRLYAVNDRMYVLYTESAPTLIPLLLAK